jgi:hypothetical protein
MRLKALPSTVTLIAQKVAISTVIPVILKICHLDNQEVGKVWQPGDLNLHVL